LAEYYKNIKGKNYDRKLLDLAGKLNAESRRCLFTKVDVQRLYDVVADADKYTDVEKRTMHYIRKNYKFTEAADALFRTKIRSWAAKRGWKTRKMKAKKK